CLLPCYHTVLVSIYLRTPTLFSFFFFNDTAPTEIYTLSLHDALPISAVGIDWYRLIGDGLVVGVDRFGASAPEKVLADAYNLTPQKIAKRVIDWLGQAARQ